MNLPPLTIGPHTIPRPIILAPMAGVSEAPYRALVHEMGAGLTPTELISSKGLQYANDRTIAFLKHDPKVEPIFNVQLFGGEPESMATGAAIAADHGAKIIDINMGCPVKKVTKTGAGSALMCDPERAVSILQAIRQRVGHEVPVTAKLRAGWDKDSKNAPEVAKRLEDAGLAAVTLHPRTRCQGYAGTADWPLIAKLKEAVSIPVIANGDITSVATAARVIEETNCDAIMVGRAALGNPWLFAELAAAHRGSAFPPPPTPAERADFIQNHLALHLEHLGDEVRAVRKFRQHLIWYSRGMRGGAAFREGVMRLNEHDQVVDAIRTFFARTEVQDRSETPTYDNRSALG